LKHFEAASWPVVAPGSDARGPAHGVRINVGAKMREMWR
jgi:DNA helicase II / ATP-dependent DNA helicase PcrA